MRTPLMATALLALIASVAAPAAETPAPAKAFTVTLPDAKRPLPEPLPAGAAPGFARRGLKGWAWTPEQYLAEIPYLVKFRMNFMMNCYLTMFDYEHHPTGSASHMAGEANRWWEEVPAAKKAALERVVAECQRNGIEFCFSMNPNYLSRRLLGEDRATLDALWKHYAWMQGLGVRWFNLSVDDAKHGINPVTQSRVVNEIFRRLRAADPGAQFIFTPTIYSGDGTGAHRTGTDRKTYLEGLAREMHPDIYFFWTGDGGFRPTTRAAAESYRRISGHRLFYWDNYPVNDGRPTLHLGPVINRPADLGEVVDGYISNPHHTQNEINRLPLATCADYAYNPRAYDPARSIGQAILHLADTREQQLVLKDLVETYPGMLILGKNTAKFSPVREELGRILSRPDSQAETARFLDSLRQLAARLKAAFPDRYQPEKVTLDREIELLTAVAAGRQQMDLFSRPGVGP